MAIIAWPDTLTASQFSWSQVRNDLVYKSQFGSQAVEVAVPTWSATIEAPPMLETNTGAWKALGMQLRGKVNQLSLHNLARPVPIGTMRGSMTFNLSAAQGATTLSIVATGQNSKTLLQGDMLGFGSGITTQAVMVMTNATSNGSGVISVTVEPPLRNAFTGGDPITWSKPAALFRRIDSKFGWTNSGIIAGAFSLDLVEDWRA